MGKVLTLEPNKTYAVVWTIDIEIFFFGEVPPGGSVAWTKTGTVDVNTSSLGTQVCELTGPCSGTGTGRITVGVAPLRIN